MNIIDWKAIVKFFNLWAFETARPSKNKVSLVPVERQLFQAPRWVERSGVFRNKSQSWKHCNVRATQVVSFGAKFCMIWDGCWGFGAGWLVALGECQIQKDSLRFLQDAVPQYAKGCKTQDRAFLD